MKILYRFAIVITAIVAVGELRAQKNYEYTVDLTKVSDDKLVVELLAPKMSGEEVTFYLPKIIPGTYAIADYGRLVSELEAFDKSGKTLPVEKADVNSWKIKNASKLHKVRYRVEDTFDMTMDGPSVFWPAGTNIEEGKNYLLNPSGFFGYFDNYKDLPYKFNVVRSKEMYGSTGLIPEVSGVPITKLKLELEEPSTNAVVDVFKTEDYDRLVDSPLMYGKADTAVIKVANTEVLVSSYSPNNVINAKQIANSIRQILQAQHKFLGGKLPVDKYAFIFYWTDKPVKIYGALEHSYSSVYYMPEAPIEVMDGQVKDFAAHEFFHIVTPLTIHSEEIHRFGFNDPKMSRHLWLYEGVTEYFAGSVQVKYGLISREEYIDRMSQKMKAANNFIDDVAFTDISSFTLDKYSDQYSNVYLKGALIGMSLDIKLRALSNGEYGLQNLIADLSKKYGKSKPFQDEELFDVITDLTYPEIGVFLTRHVGGPEPLPFADIFSLVGMNYEPVSIRHEVSLGFEGGAVGVGKFEEKDKLVISNKSKLNEQGVLTGFENGDVLLAINGEDVPELGEQLNPYFEKHKAALREGDTIRYTVARKKDTGVEKMELSSVLKKVERKTYHVLKFNESATPEQTKIREAWLNP